MLLNASSPFGVSSGRKQPRTLSQRRQWFNLGESVVSPLTALLQKLADKENPINRATVPCFCALVDLACREEKIPKPLYDFAESDHAAILEKMGESEVSARHRKWPDRFDFTGKVEAEAAALLKEPNGLRLRDAPPSSSRCLVLAAGGRWDQFHCPETAFPLGCCWCSAGP